MSAVNSLSELKIAKSDLDLGANYWLYIINVQDRLKCLFMNPSPKGIVRYEMDTLPNQHALDSLRLLCGSLHDWNQGYSEKSCQKLQSQDHRMPPPYYRNSDGVCSHCKSLPMVHQACGPFSRHQRCFYYIESQRDGG